MIICPCVKCERNGCGAYHDECEKYQAFRKEKLAEYEKRKEENERVIPKKTRRCKKWNLKI